MFTLRWSKNPLLAFINSHIINYPIPVNLNYMWSFGSLTGLVLVIQIITGIFLVMHYTPHVDLAFSSVEHIMRDVNNGWLIRYVHANGASLFFIVTYVHIFRGLYFGSYMYLKAILWCSGVVIFLLMMATAFMGYVLLWGQMSFWGATVITNLFSAVSLIGGSIVEWFCCGFSVYKAALTQFLKNLSYLTFFLLIEIVCILTLFCVYTFIFKTKKYSLVNNQFKRMNTFQLQLSANYRKFSNSSVYVKSKISPSSIQELYLLALVDAVLISDFVFNYFFSFSILTHYMEFFFTFIALAISVIRNLLGLSELFEFEMPSQAQMENMGMSRSYIIFCVITQGAKRAAYGGGALSFMAYSIVSLSNRNQKLNNDFNREKDKGLEKDKKIIVQEQDISTLRKELKDCKSQQSSNCTPTGLPPAVPSQKKKKTFFIKWESEE